MKITILTLFPEMFDGFLNNSIIKRAVAKGCVEFKIVNIRDYTLDKNHRVDNPPVGGGAGLIMKCQPIVDALKANTTDKSYKILFSPRGKQYKQEDAIRFSKLDELVLLCGHYEGIDERVNKYVDELISIGDYVLTGGEIPAMAVSDSITRLIDGVITDISLDEESFGDNLLEYPQFAEPYDFNGDKIPDILYTGNHQAIAKYHRKESLKLTKQYRPDLFEKHTKTKEDIKLLKEIENNDENPEWIQKALVKGKKYVK